MTLGRVAPVNVAFVCCSVLLALLARPGTAHAQVEQVTIALPSVVTFDVADGSSSTIGTPAPTNVQYSGARIKNRRVLRISVIADASSFTGPGGTALAASAVSWTVSNATGGVGTSGVLSATSYNQVFQSSVVPSAGGFDMTWALAALPAGIRAGTYTLTLRWKIESVLP